VLTLGEQLAQEADAHWQTGADREAAARWQRDRALLRIASKARMQRTQRAWERLGANSGAAPSRE
jgi:hypothetical protein